MEFLRWGGPRVLRMHAFVFSIWVQVLKPSFISCYKTSMKSLLNWHCTLPEVLALTPPFADDLEGTFDMPECSWIIVKTLSLEVPQSEACLATLIRRSFSTSLSTRSIISWWLMTSIGRPGLLRSLAHVLILLTTLPLWNTLSYYHHTHQPCANGFLWRMHSP